jgi:hypothetical protein
MKKALLFTLLIFCCFCINLLADSLFERRLIFSVNQPVNHLGLHHSTILGVNGWVYVLSDEQDYYFHTFIYCNYADLPNVIYTGNWPTPDAQPNENNTDYNPKMNATIVCQWDEADLTLVSVNEVVNGYLLDTPFFYNEPCDDDEDIYAFIPSCRNYCIELNASCNVRMSICQAPGTYSEIPLIATDFVYDNSTAIVKRFYKSDWNVGQTYYIKIHGEYDSPVYSRNRHYYSFVIKNVRPVFLVHSLSEGPTNHVDTATSFGDVKNDLDMMAGMQPMKIFDFPWNSTEGSYQQYCVGPNSLYSFVQNCTDFVLKPLVITHSFGSMLVLQQIINNANFLPLLGKFIFLAPNFGGSDHDVSMLTKFFPDASQENLYSMRNGTEHIWFLLKDIPQAFFNLPASYVIGLDDMSIGVSDSDGVVTASSASLPNTMNKEGDYIYLNLNNKNISDLSFPVPADSEYKSILDLIKGHAKD